VCPSWRLAKTNFSSKKLTPVDQFEELERREIAGSYLLANHSSESKPQILGRVSRNTGKSFPTLRRNDSRFPHRNQLDNGRNKMIKLANGWLDATDRRARTHEPRNHELGLCSTRASRRDGSLDTIALALGPRSSLGWVLDAQRALARADHPLALPGIFQPAG
jgi:hypothetical protein